MFKINNKNTRERETETERVQNFLISFSILNTNI